MLLLSYLSDIILNNEAQIREMIMIVSGIGIAISASVMNITSLAYGGLAISGLGVISIFWK